MISKQYPLISIIVPAWNEEKYLKKLLPNLVTQDYPNCEIIVVDNNSSDITSEVAKSFGVKVVSEVRQGISFARARGFEEAQGEIIIRTDADTIPNKDWVSKYYEEFKKFPEAVAISGSSEFFDGGLVLKIISKYIFLGVIYLVRIVMGHYPLNGPNFAVKKSIVKKTKPHTDDSLIHEDMDLACHLNVYGSIKFIPGIIISTSARRLFKDPLFMVHYFVKSIRTYLLHHPNHKFHDVS